ncbi:MAG TPA: hypothetical protein VLA49_07485, partial [Anaerolineales bacterium]|nr:hypothetical protein [Anaerolineales bacterium]
GPVFLHRSFTPRRRESRQHYSRHAHELVEDIVAHAMLAVCWSSNNRPPAARPILDGKSLAFEDQASSYPKKSRKLKKYALQQDRQRA